MNANYEQMQHFITDSPWSAAAVTQQVAADAQEFLKDVRGETAMLIDEYSCRKQGEHSVGVSRQYLGCLGTVDNGQVAVVSTLSKSIYTVIVGTRLFLPESWTENTARMQKAGVPPEAQAFATKPEIALQMLTALCAQGIKWDFTGGDGLYGNSTAYRRGVDALGEYVLDVHADQTVYLHDPKPVVPERRSEVGRAPSRLQTHHHAWRADELIKIQPASAWKTEQYRVGTKGAMRRQVLVMTVWTWDGIEETAVKERLIASRRTDKSDIKYALSNDRNVQHSAHRLLVRQMHRHWIERSIEDAKQELGFTEYHVRSWQAWEHHAALTMVALLFLMQERLVNKGTMPLLSCRDVRNMIAHKLGNKTDDTASLVAVIEERHRRRASDKARWKVKSNSG